MDFQSWYREKVENKISKKARLHPMMHQLKMKADSKLIKNYDNQIKSIFDVDSFKPNRIDKIHYKIIGFKNKFSNINTLSFVYRNLKKGFSSIKRSLSYFSNRINNKFESVMINENKLDIEIIDKTRYEKNTITYRMLVFRKYGNFIREIFQVQKYHILEPHIKNKQIYSIYYKIFKIATHRRKRIQTRNIFLFIAIGLLYYNTYLSQRIINYNTDQIIFDENKDKYYNRIFRLTEEIISGKYFQNKEEYMEFIDKSEQFADNYLSLEEKKDLFFYTCYYALLFISSIVSMRVILTIIYRVIIPICLSFITKCFSFIKKIFSLITKIFSFTNA